MGVMNIVVFMNEESMQYSKLQINLSKTNAHI